MHAENGIQKEKTSVSMISISLFGKIYRSVYFCDSMNKAAKTRQYIIEQVAPVFNKQGYAGTA